jgi:hypothetical protein
MSDSDDTLDLAEFVTDWLAIEFEHKVGGERHFAASQQLWLQTSSDAFIGYLLVALVAASTSEPRLLAHLGAGPLEDLLRREPRRFIPLVASEARSNLRLREALRSVWLSPDDAPAPLLELLVSAVPGWSPLIPRDSDSGA